MKSKLLFLLFGLAILASCANEPQQQTGVLIKGNIPKKGSIANGTDSLFLDDVAKVLLFSPPSFSHGVNYKVVDMQNGSFEIDATMGTAVALIFLTSNYEYVGNLSVNDFNLLPLGNLSGGENTVIDLSSLSLVGNHVIPSHDPFGNEIILSQEALQSYQELDAYYEALAKNLDTDNDGIMDFLNHKEVIVTTRFGLNFGGHYGLNSTPPSGFDSSNYTISYCIQINGGASVNPVGSDVVLSGPIDNPYPDISLFWMAPVQPGNGFFSLFVRSAGSFLPFEEGIYTLTVNGNEIHTFQYSNIEAKDNLVVVSPTLNTNANNEITNVTLDYKLPNGVSIDPTMVLSDIIIEFEDSTHTQFFSSSPLTTKTGFYNYTLSTPINLSQLYHITLHYEDMLGNSYLMGWQ